MELMKRLEPLFLGLMMLGAFTWLIVALFDTNIVTEVTGTGTAADVVYVVFGVAALAFVPRLLEGLHSGRGHDARPHGA
ncbi:MAG: DUF378 domain-containing protein [Solirubrobacteraceae bacterium]